MSEHWSPWRLVFLHWVVFSFLFTFKCLVSVYTRVHTHMCHGSRVEVRTTSGSSFFLLSRGSGDGSHAARLGLKCFTAEPSLLVLQPHFFKKILSMSSS